MSGGKMGGQYLKWFVWAFPSGGPSAYTAQALATGRYPLLSLTRSYFLETKKARTKLMYGLLLLSLKLLLNRFRLLIQKHELVVKSIQFNLAVLIYFTGQYLFR